MSTIARRVRLHVCRLEDRFVPAATAVLNSGVLRLVGDVTDDTISVSVNAGNSMDVTVNGGATQTFAVSKGLIANLGAGSDTFTIDLNSNASNLLYLTVLGGGGNDEVTITGGTIRARTLIDGGSGNDALAVDGAILSGPRIKVTGGSGDNDSISLKGTLSGQVVVSRAVAIGFSGATINGDLNIINDQGIPAYTNFFYTAVNGNLRYSGSFGNDDVAFDGGLGVTGAVSMSLGSGTNNVSISSTRLGFTSISAGSGNDIFVDHNSTIAGMTARMGDGKNKFDSSSEFTGNVTIRTGNGFDTVLAGTDMYVHGNLELHLGDGRNTLSAVGNVAGALIYASGSGTNTISISGARFTSYAIIVSTGIGNDSFTYAHLTNNLDPAYFDINLGLGKNTFGADVPVTWPSQILGV